MDDKLFLLLSGIIPRSFISVQNSKLASIYSFEIPDGDDATTYVELYSYYSHSDNKNSYVAYELYIDTEFVAYAIKPAVNIQKQSKRSKRTKNISLADKLETLISLCSLKLIQQEYKCQSRHMLKTFLNLRNQNIQ